MSNFSFIEDQLLVVARMMVIIVTAWTIAVAVGIVISAIVVMRMTDLLCWRLLRESRIGQVDDTRVRQ